MVSVYSVIWTIFNCSLMAFILMILRRNTSFLQRYGTAALILLTTCCTIRMIFPVEFPEHQHILSDPIFLSRIQGTYEHYLYLLTYKPLLIRIWVGGTLLFITVYSFYYMMIQFRIHGNSCLAEDHINDILHQIDPECPMKIYISPDISVPVSAGILRSNIYLPEYGYTQTDLYYVILHEYKHWKRKDMAKKVGLYLLSSVMWWNPFLYLLRNEYIQLLEFNCDRAVSKDLNDVEVTDYLQSLYNTQRFLQKNKRHLNTSTTAMEFLSTKRKEQSTIKQRFALLIYQEEEKHRVMRALLVMTILLWMAASYYFLPQPYYTPFSTDASTNEEFQYYTINDIQIEVSEENKYNMIFNNMTVGLNENDFKDKSHSHYSITKHKNSNSILFLIKRWFKNIFY